MLRRRVSVQSDPVANFWEWWGPARSRVEAAIASGEYGTLPDEIGAHVEAIDSGLEWELGAGQQAKHVLCVTPAGNPALRAVAERWRIAGLAPDATWEYAAARAPDPSAARQILDFEGTRLTLADTRAGISVDDDRQVLDVVVYHPQFASMSHQARGSVAYLVLDWLLGEDGVERWIGTVDTLEDEPSASVPIDAVHEILEGLQARHPEPKWAVLGATGPDGRRVLAVARRPLKRVEYPLFDLHGELALRFDDQTPEGLPAPGALEHLRAFEDKLVAVCGDELLLAAHQTHAGTRIFHVYCDSQARGRSVVDDLLAGRQWPGARVDWRMDPSWDAIRPFR